MLGRLAFHLVLELSLTDSLSGKLVVASPGMDDPNFRHAVILMVEHSEEGALGVVLNKGMDTRVDEVWDQVSSLPCPVDQALLRGGPCPGPLMLLHDKPEQAQVQVCQGVCFTTEAPRVEQLLLESARPLRFFLGYAGWGAGQLEDELDQSSWLVTPAHADVVFDPDPDDGLWMRVITGIDRALAMLAMNPKIMPSDPSMN